MKHPILATGLAVAALFVANAPASSAQRAPHSDIARFCSERWESPSLARACVSQNESSARYVLRLLASGSANVKAIAGACIAGEGGEIEWSIVKLCIDTKVAISSAG